MSVADAPLVHLTLLSLTAIVSIHFTVLTTTNDVRNEFLKMRRYVATVK